MTTMDPGRVSLLTAPLDEITSFSSMLDAGQRPRLGAGGEDDRALRLRASRRRPRP